jgi:hypothetical protein
MTEGCLRISMRARRRADRLRRALI